MHPVWRVSVEFDVDEDQRLLHQLPILIRLAEMRERIKT
jgi:hypothetical protein